MAVASFGSMPMPLLGQVVLVRQGRNDVPRCDMT